MQIPSLQIHWDKYVQVKPPLFFFLFGNFGGIDIHALVYINQIIIHCSITMMIYVSN
jgi:hypothetical protein